MNIFEDGDRIVLDVARSPRLEFGTEFGGEPAVLHR